MGRAGAGEEEALRALYDEHAGPLLVFASRALGDHDAAQDVVQEALLRAWRRAGQYDPDRGPLRAWLFGITRNLVADAHRSGASRSTPSAMVTDLAEAPQADDIDRAVDAWHMAEALRRLTDRHRAVIVETYYRGRTVREAAAALGIPPGTVKSRLHYAMRALRLALEEQGAVR